MTFLNPFVLIGLLAAAIPIILHLLNLRKLRTIEFSTLAFLKELQATKIKRLKLRQMLLLILRTLLVILLVLAFARPTLKGTVIGTLGSHTRTSAVIILDDSFSMTVSDDQGELFKQAKLAADDIIPLFKDGDEVFLIKLSSLGTAAPLHQIALRDFSFLRKTIDESQPSAVRHSIEEGLRVAASLLSSTQNFNREVFVFSDFQTGVLKEEETSSAQKENLFSRETRFFFVPLGKRAPQNFGIESITIPSSIFERDKPFTVQARVANYSGSNAQDHVVSVFLNGTRVGERSIDIPNHGSTTAEFSVATSATGFVDGFVELEDDDFQYDNRRYFVVQIPERVRVLLVGNAQDVQYSRLALATRTSPTESALELDNVTPARLSSVEIKRADVIILCTSEGLSTAQVSEISAFARSGGGIILFPGATVDPSAFNAQIAAGLRGPSLLAVDRPTTPRAQVESFTEFDKVDLRHPLFQGMFESPGANAPRSSTAGTPAGRTVESPRIRISARFALTPRSNAIITLTNGAAFLTEQSIGAGRMLIYAVPPNSDWSDFPLKGIFVPLLHRSVLYLARQSGQAEEIRPGSEVVIRSSTASTNSWVIRTPEKVDITTTPSLQAYERLVHFSNTEQPGVYSVFDNQIPIHKFVVNLDPRESQTAKASSGEIDALLNSAGIKSSAVHDIRQIQSLGQAVLQSRFGVELWRYLLTMALIVAVIELFVARSTKREILKVQKND